jgi:hypothetical protein
MPRFPPSLLHNAHFTGDNNVQLITRIALVGDGLTVLKQPLNDNAGNLLKLLRGPISFASMLL